MPKNLKISFYFFHKPKSYHYGDKTLHVKGQKYAVNNINKESNMIFHDSLKFLLLSQVMKRHIS